MDATLHPLPAIPRQHIPVPSLVESCRALHAIGVTPEQVRSWHPCWSFALAADTLAWVYSRTAEQAAS